MYFKNRKKYLVPFFLFAVLMVLPGLDPWLLNSQETRVISWAGYGGMLPGIVLTLTDYGILVSWLLLYFRFRFAVLFVLVIHIIDGAVLLMNGIAVITNLESFFGSLYYVLLGVLLTDAFRSDKK